MAYDRSIPDYAKLITIETFVRAVKAGAYIDYDGFGYPARDPKLLPWMTDVDIKMDDSKRILPSDINKTFGLPHDATHIVWFNK